ncbi:MAG: RDD family protein [Actinomycetota bacterium]|nr:RDD family protein [Actinomycetota bacterium]MDP2288931.1 RDD family protein [Actinomycetota bacterium]
MSSPEPARLPTARVRVPEAAKDFQGLRAGIVSRVLANIADVIIIVITTFTLYMCFASVKFMFDPRNFTWPALHMGWFVIVCGILLFVYFTFSWATSGRTVGNRLMGLRVVNHRGLIVRWSGAVVRAAFCVAFPFGLFWAIISRQNRSVQDVVLRTSVIYDWAPNRANLGHES